MKLIYFAVALFVSIGISSGYNYIAAVDDTIKQINRMLYTYAGLHNQNFYPYQVANTALVFKQFADNVASYGNADVLFHVSHLRTNYTFVNYLLDNLVNDTRQAIYNDIIAQTVLVSAQGPLAVETCQNVYTILMNKRCSSAVVDSFFASMIASIYDEVARGISEANSPYISSAMTAYAPFYLMDELVNQLTLCIPNVGPPTTPVVEPFKCLVRKEDLYLNPTISLLSDSFTAVTNLLTGFNRRIADYSISTTQDILAKSYQAAFTLKC